AFLAHLGQLAEEFPAAAVEQLHGGARRQAQYATDVVGLGLGQFVVAEGKRGVDEEAGKAHGQAAGGKREGASLKHSGGRRHVSRRGEAILGRAGVWVAAPWVSPLAASAGINPAPHITDRVKTPPRRIASHAWLSRLGADKWR